MNLSTAHKQGFSAVAALVIAAVVVIGGVAATSINSNNTADTNDDRPAANPDTAPADQSSSASTQTVFNCADGQQVRLDFGAEDNITLTLPGGETRTVTRTQVDGETQFESADGSLVFRNAEDGAVIERNGQITVSGCLPSRARSGTSSAGARTEAGSQAQERIQTEVNSEAEAQATTTTGSAEVQADVQTEVDASSQ